MNDEPGVHDVYRHHFQYLSLRNWFCHRGPLIFLLPCLKIVIDFECYVPNLRGFAALLCSSVIPTNLNLGPDIKKSSKGSLVSKHNCSDSWDLVGICCRNHFMGTRFCVPGVLDFNVSSGGNKVDFQLPTRRTLPKRRFLNTLCSHLSLWLRVSDHSESLEVPYSHGNQCSRQDLVNLVPALKVF